MHFGKYKKIILFSFLLICVIVLFLYFSRVIQNFLLNYLHIFADYFRYHKILGIFIFAALSVAAVLLSPFSNTFLIPAAVAAWGKFLTLLIVSTGWLLGGVIVYFIGSYSRGKFIRHFVSLKKIEYYKNKIPAESQFWIVFLFRLAIPSEIAGYVLGVARYEFRKYLLATFLSELPLALFAVYFSSVLIEGRVVFFAVAVIIGVLVTGFLFYVFKKKIK